MDNLRAKEAVIVPVSGLTVDTAIYASGDLISKGGTVLTADLSRFRDKPGFVIRSIGVVDKAKQSSILNLLFLDAALTTTVLTDNAALTIADADMASIVGSASIAVADYIALADNSFAFVDGLYIPVRLPITDATPTLRMLLASGGTPTYVAATDLSIRLGITEV